MPEDAHRADGLPWCSPRPLGAAYADPGRVLIADTGSR
jgi:hypothetical protein